MTVFTNEDPADPSIHERYDTERLLQIRRSHASARPKASNPAWFHTHNDLTFVLSCLDAEIAKNSQQQTAKVDPLIETLKAAISAGRVSHTRAGSGLYRGAVLVYENKPDSPGGVQLLCAIDETPDVQELLRGRLAPLSPTEQR